MLKRKDKADRIPWWNQEDQARLAAAQLADSLGQGWRPPPMDAPIALFEGEVPLYQADFSLWEHTAQNVSYNQSTFVGLGSPVFLVATLGLSAVSNADRRRQAQAQAALQWRQVNRGTMWFTSLRFGLQGVTGWKDILFSHVRSSQCLTDGIVVFLDNQPPLKIALAGPEYFYILFRLYAYGKIPPLALDEDFRRKAKANGKTVPLLANELLPGSES